MIYAILVEESIGALYTALVVPALLTVLFYFGAIMLTCAAAPASAPKGDPWDGREIASTFVAAIPAILLFGVVFGGIFFGVFTATEAAGVGAVAAFVLMVARAA